MKLAIIDPGLIQSAGHHYEINKSLCEESHINGLQCTIFCHSDFRRVSNDDINFYAVGLFKLQPYLVSAKPNYRLRDSQRFTIYELARLEFLNALIKLHNEFDHFIIPTAFHYMLQAVADFRTFGSRKPVDVVFHTYPNQAQSGPFELNRELLMTSFDSISEAPENTRVHTIEGGIQLDLERLIRRGTLHVHRAPIPHNGYKRTVPQTSISSLTIAGHLSRKEKGIQHLYQISKIAKDLNLNLVIQDSTPSSAIKSLNLSSETKFYGYIHDFPRFIGNQELIVLPYDRDFYRYSGSGVAWESIASGIPLLCPIGTNPSITAREFGCGTFYTADDFESFSSSLRQIVDNYAAYSERSFAASRLFTEVNGTAAFFRHLTHHHVLLS
jgi:glycosyltransferase involved in cell wall biosynthesis